MALLRVTVHYVNEKKLQVFSR